MCVYIYIYISILFVYVMFGIFFLTNEFILLYFIINIVLIYFILWYQGHRHREGTNIVLPPGMKCYPSQFARLPYYEDLKIAHLFDTMHIGKNVIEMLWRIIDGAHDRDKIVKIRADIDKLNHAMKRVIDWSNNNGGQNYNNIHMVINRKTKKWCKRGR